jgi:hypothetical protein
MGVAKVLLMERNHPWLPPALVVPVPLVIIDHLIPPDKNPFCIEKQSAVSLCIYKCEVMYENQNKKMG